MVGAGTVVVAATVVEVVDVVVLGVVVGATVGSSVSVVVGARSVVAPAVDAVLRSSVEALHTVRTDATKRTARA